MTAGSVLVGWFFDMPALTRVLPEFAPMTANTAIGLLASAGALWAYQNGPGGWHDRAVKALTGTAIVVGFVAAVAAGAGWPLDLSQWLAPVGAGADGLTGDSGFATAGCLLLLSAAVLSGRQAGRYWLAQILAGGAAMLGLLSAVGYFFEVASVGGMAAYTVMSFPTSICVLLLCFGFVFANPEDGMMEAVIDEGPGGLVIRQLLPAVFLLPLLLAWFTWQGLRIDWYGAGFAMALFVALITCTLTYAVWFGGRILRRFEDRRAAAERERLQSEARLRRAVTDAPIPMVIHDDADRILHMSRGWTYYSGYTIEETGTLTEWMERTQATNRFAVRAYLEKSASPSDAASSTESAITARTGETRVWEFSTTPLGVVGTGHRTFVTMAVDITERKNAETELRQINENLEQRIAERTQTITEANDVLQRQSAQLQEQAALLDLVRDGIIVRDLRGTIVYWSEGATQMYGWAREDALGQVTHTMLKTAYPSALSEIERQALSGGSWEGEVTQTTRNGAKLLVESRWTLTRNERNVPQGFLEVNRDVTARRRAQDALRDSEQRFRSVAETANDGLVTADRTGTIRYWNPGAERMFGLSAAETVGQPLAMLMPATSRDSSMASLSQIVETHDQTGSQRTMELTCRRKDGTEFPAEISLSSWDTSQGVFFTGILRDITERKQAEQALQDKNEELGRSNQELEQFAYVASHDLQEPLRMVSNYTQMLATRYRDRLDGDAIEFIEFAVDGAKRMQALIHDLLEYARVGTRGKEFKPTPCDRIVQDAVANLSGAIADAGAEVAIGELPTLRCDGVQLTQVFQNLIGNALKFRRPDVAPIIRVMARREGHDWVFDIADNGIGIAPKYFERIFQMFQRLHGRGEYEGTGIGLALCKKIVERHGGRIAVTSTPGEGTTFSFTIPESAAAAKDGDRA